MSNLKPCPFCGSDDIQAQGWNNFTVICKDCGANGPVVSHVVLSVEMACQAAERQWNEREGDDLVHDVEFSSNAMSVYVKKGDQYYEYTLADFYGGKGNEDAE